jgi:PKD domain
VLPNPTVKGKPVMLTAKALGIDASKLVPRGSGSQPSAPSSRVQYCPKPPNVQMEWDFEGDGKVNLRQPARRVGASYSFFSNDLYCNYSSDQIEHTFPKRLGDPAVVVKKVVVRAVASLPGGQQLPGSAGPVNASQAGAELVKGDPLSVSISFRVDAVAEPPVAEVPGGSTTPTTPPPPTENKQPTARFSVSHDPIRERCDITFDGRASSDPDGTIEEYSWDLDGNGSYGDRKGATVTYRYPYTEGEATSVTVGLRVTDNGDRTATVRRTLRISPPACGSGAAVTAAAVRATASARRRARGIGFTTRSLLIPTDAGSMSQAGHFLVRSRAVKTIGSVRAKTRRRRFSSSLRTAFAGFERAAWVGRFNMTRDLRLPRSRGVYGTGIVLSQPRRRSRRGDLVCMRVRIDFRRGKRANNRFTVIGGRGRGATLRASGRFPTIQLKNKASDKGAITSARRGKRRGLPRSCRALTKHLKAARNTPRRIRR